MNTVDRVLRRPEFADAPPVLIDVGASSGVHSGWKELAKHSICIAFDADDRGMTQTRRESSAYKELYVYNRALTCGGEAFSDFYLTEDAPCSSLLPPNSQALAAWEFAGRFSVVQKTRVPTIHLQTVLADLNLNRVDWFKTDSQGTDLRLFLSLGKALIERVVVAEFEPGIIEAYHEDDKLWSVMASMHHCGFWMSDIAILGSSRIRKEIASAFTPTERKFMFHLLKTSPGWAEVVYLNSFAAPSFTQREYLLGWVCASMQRQHGFALELASNAKKLFGDPIFAELERQSVRSIRRSYLNVPAYFPLIRRALRRWKRLGFRWQHPTGASAQARSAAEKPSSSDA